MTDKTRTMQFAPAAAPDQAGLNVAPLIDIVFLLIGFYLLVAQLITHQKDLSVQLPAMASPAGREESPAEFVINVRDDGTITVGGRPAALPDLRAMLADQLARTRGAEQPLRVVVRADRRGRAGKLDEVLQACREVGLQRIVFRSARKDSP
jgi:biopolymer transport protein ExbD